jgi:hypothetical protein
VTYVAVPGTLRVTNAGGVLAVATGDKVQVELEQMTVTAIRGSGPWRLDVTRAAPVAHNAGEVVYRVVGDNIVQVTNTGGSSSVVVGDTIKVNNAEQMVVTAVDPFVAGVWNLTVTRAATKLAADPTKAVTYVAVPGVVVVTNAGGPLSVAVGDTIQVDAEQMTVNSIAGSGPWRLAVTRAAPQPHTSGKTVYKVILDTLVQVTNTGGTSVVHVGDTIQIDTEKLDVLAVDDGGPDTYNLTVDRGTPRGSHILGAVVKQVIPHTIVRVTNLGGISEVSVGDVIIVDTEKMLVNAIVDRSANIWDLLVTRAFGTGEFNHGATAVVRAETLNGTALLPGKYIVRDSGPLTLPQGLSPGGTFTYYGGLCIGIRSGTSCNNSTCVPADAITTSSAFTPAITATIPDTTTLDLTISGGGGTQIVVGDYIRLNNAEKMKVTQVVDPTHLKVTRGEFGSARFAVTAARALTFIVGSPEVTLKPGVYIMAGGGFRVCGAATLNAPNVLIHNTSDPGYSFLDQIQFNTTGSITLGPQASGVYNGLTIYQRVGERMSGYTFEAYGTAQKLVGDIDDTTTDIVSSGSGVIHDNDFIRIDSETMQVIGVTGTQVTVLRGQQGSYKAAHQDNDAINLVTGAACDNRAANLTDILFTKSSNGLDGMSGTIYAPDPYSLFSDSMDGEANLAVITGCLFIDGGDTIFHFVPNGLFGSGGEPEFIGQWG